MGKNEPAKHRKRLKSWPDIRFKSKYNTNPSVDEDKYKTTPVQSKTPEEHTTKSQQDYIKNHLKVKAAIVDNKQPPKYQITKTSIRDYIPKTINQEITMGMWIWPK